MMTDRELFDDNFHKWLAAHGATITGWDGKQHAIMKVNLNDLKLGIYQRIGETTMALFGTQPADPPRHPSWQMDRQRVYVAEMQEEDPHPLYGVPVGIFSSLAKAKQGCQYHWNMRDDSGTGTLEWVNSMTHSGWFAQAGDYTYIIGTTRINETEPDHDRT